MHSSMKRFLALLLAILMLSALCISCAQGDDPNSQDTTSDQNNELPDGWTGDELPGGLNFEESGKKGSITMIGFTGKDIAPDDANNSEPLSDAMYYRNLHVEERLGVEIKGILREKYDDVNTDVKTAVLGGSDDYQIVLTQMVFGTSALAMDGKLMNLYDLQYYNPDSPWWDKNVDKAFQIGDTLYMTAGDMLPANMLVSSCIAFNKAKATDLQIGCDTLYDLGRNGEWTISKMITYTENVTTDKNGDGVIDTEHDFYGLTSWHLDSPFNFFYGSGLTVFAKDDDNIPYYEADVQKIEDVYEQVYQLFITNNSYYETNVDVAGNPFDVFTDGRALFTSCSLSTVSNTKFKDMPDKFGVLPQPKYVETDEYLSFVNGAADMVCVPLSVTNPDMVGAVLEALGNASYNLVTDVLVEKICKAKNVNDPESAEMVDIVFRHRIYDFGYVHYFPLDHNASVMFRVALDGKQTSCGRLASKCNDSKLKSKLRQFLHAYGVEQ